MSSHSPERRFATNAEFEGWLQANGIDLKTFPRPERRSDQASRGNGGKTGVYVAIAGALVLALLVAFQNRVVEGLFNPPFTQAERDQIRDNRGSVDSLRQRVDLLATERDGTNIRLQQLEKKLDRLLWKSGIDPDTVR